MAYRLIHLHLCSHGAPTALTTIDYACALSKAFGAALRVTSPRLDVKAPSHWLAGRMLAGLANNIEQAAAAKANELDAHLEKTASALGVTCMIEPVPELWPQNSDDVTIHGRTSDVCVLGLPRDNPEQRLNIEAWLFGAGRPCLFHPDDRATSLSLDTAVIAWDAGKSAARAVGDALPLLKRVKAVHILVARGEKSIPGADPAAALIALLAAHAISAHADEFDVGQNKIGAALLGRAAHHNADLLVLGAFGHSRLKEFILGGATREVLDKASLPVLMSH